MVQKILFVCLGNICRSPAAEGIFNQKIKERDLEKLFVVDSAGTGSWHVGNLPDKRMRATALSRGIELTSRSRQIEENDLYEFDQILVMDKDNLDAVKSLTKDDMNPVNSKIKLILSYSKNSQLEEVPDPYYGGQNGFEQVLDLLNDAIDELIDSLID
ncbi:low molecular weight protein-tyrosine-phosphatase [Prochlorococcus marinus]|uniref:protein-tyrosine-phosphatase n=1 Tax=Prochlorococcus marinus XMU1408 TaxID=2213228 RepID=A0A318R6F1_PROMR|nr:low molecular weight protein-tyrosine-phosphatase [Prochlorococcus marinus]MBW3042815.1 protein tyrosine phosphatase [Prochlorococcus marinus str. XMU1408]PYE00642.1 protein tyrosine phosphatase [Prochlorococcus marinus XMU1408]